MGTDNDTLTTLSYLYIYICVCVCVNKKTNIYIKKFSYENIGS